MSGRGRDELGNGAVLGMESDIDSWGKERR